MIPPRPGLGKPVYSRIVNDHRRALSVLATAVAIPLAVYAATLQRAVPAGDSGELIAAAKTLGVAHPPGYPLYTMLGHLWIALVPFGSAATRMNLLSAVCTAGAAMLLADAVRRLTRSPAAGLVAALLLAFSAPLWKYALVAEVFALNALLAASLLWLFVRWQESPRSAVAFGIGLLCTLLLSHHHTLVLVALPVAVAMLVAVARGRSEAPFPRGRSLRAGFLGATTGLVPLAYLPWAAHRNPALNWGDPRSLDSFLRVLLRRDYGTFRLDPEQAGHVADTNHAILYLQSLPQGFTWLGVALALVGAAALARRHRALGAVIAGFFVLQTLFFTRVGFPSHPLIFRGVVERFYIMPNVVLALMAGLGAALVLEHLRGGVRRTAAAALVVAAFAWPVVLQYRAVDQRGNTLTEDLCRGVLASVPERGVLFSQGDLFHNGLAYLQLVEGERTDVAVVDQEKLTFAWYVRALRRREPDLLPARLGREDRYDGSPESGNLAWIAHLEGKRPVTLLGLKESSYAARYEVVPTGFVLWTYSRGTADSSARSSRLDEAPGPRQQAVLALDHFASMKTESYFRRYDPWSFEADARARFAELAARTAIHLCRPEAFDIAPAEHPGFAKLIAFFDRHDAGAISSDPRQAGDIAFPPDPEVLRAEGFLFALHPAVRDAARARRNFERFLAAAPADPRVAQVRRMLELLASQED
jgi:hypothetical protein